MYYITIVIYFINMLTFYVSLIIYYIFWHYNITNINTINIYITM